MMVVAVVVALFFAVINVTSGRSPRSSLGSSKGRGRSPDGGDPCGQTKSFGAYYAKAGAHGAA
jgi:hypothetical protein